MRARRMGPTGARRRAWGVALVACAALAGCSSGRGPGSAGPTAASGSGSLPPGVHFADEAQVGQRPVEWLATPADEFASAGGLVQGSDLVASVSFGKEFNADPPMATPPLSPLRVLSAQVTSVLRGDPRAVGKRVFVVNGSWTGTGPATLEGDAIIGPGDSGIVFLRRGPAGSSYYHLSAPGAFLPTSGGAGETSKVLSELKAKPASSRRADLERIAADADRKRFTGDIGVRTPKPGGAWTDLTAADAPVRVQVAPAGPDLPGGICYRAWQATAGLTAATPPPSCVPASVLAGLPVVTVLPVDSGAGGFGLVRLPGGGSPASTVTLSLGGSAEPVTAPVTPIGPAGSELGMFTVPPGASGQPVTQGAVQRASVARQDGTVVTMESKEGN